MKGIGAMRRARRSLALGAVALAAALSGCEGDGGASGEPRGNADRRADTPSRAVQIALAGKRCPGTRPSRRPPFPGESFNYGNRYLGVAMWRRGRLVASRGGQTWGQIARDGSIRAKLGWWRAVPGRLYIVGERLDAPAPPLRASIPAGYGIRGFQSTGLIFPTPGCWRVVGSLSGHELEIVVLVKKRRRARQGAPST
jgi:hypothetical protein